MPMHLRRSGSRRLSLATVLAVATLATACSATDAGGNAALPPGIAADPLAAAPGAAASAQPASAPMLTATQVQSVATPDRRPNIVLITTDDQTLSEMAWMPRTRRLLGGQGTRFRKALSPHPLCCPARAEILTGQFAQNNGVRSNELATLGGFDRLRSKRTIATWLHAARYQTAFVGKYLNQYHREDGLEPGWDIFNPTVKRVYGYYDYTMLNNGNPKHYVRLHNADLVGQKTVDYITKFSKKNRPFFIWASQVAPHGACTETTELSCWQPPIPAKRHEYMFPAARPPSMSDPAFNEADVSDKPPAIANLEPVSPARITDTFRKRIRSLQAVDEAVADTVRALRNVGELRNTLIVFTTDNGFLLGEHRYKSKNVPYEQALRVPLLVRGPGVPAHRVRKQTVTTVDLAPTFLDFANAKANLTLDGRSFKPFFRHPARAGYDTVLIQSGPRGPSGVQYGWYYRGVRTARYTYTEYPKNGFVELYDRYADPAELTNIASEHAYRRILRKLANRTRLLGSCSGSDCRTRFGPLPSPSGT